MRLDKIRFARLVQFIHRELNDVELRDLDALTEINVEPVSIPYASVEAVNELLRHLNREGGLIEAIKAYRSLTNAGLKEAKDAVELYRHVKPKTTNEIREILGHR